MVRCCGAAGLAGAEVSRNYRQPRLRRRRAPTVADRGFRTLASSSSSSEFAVGLCRPARSSTARLSPQEYSRAVAFDGAAMQLIRPEVLRWIEGRLMDNDIQFVVTGGVAVKHYVP